MTRGRILIVYEDENGMPIVKSTEEFNGDMYVALCDSNCTGKYSNGFIALKMLEKANGKNFETVIKKFSNQCFPQLEADKNIDKMVHLEDVQDHKKGFYVTDYNHLSLDFTSKETQSSWWGTEYLFIKNATKNTIVVKVKIEKIKNLLPISATYDIEPKETGVFDWFEKEDVSVYSGLEYRGQKAF